MVTELVTVTRHLSYAINNSASVWRVVKIKDLATTRIVFSKLTVSKKMESTFVVEVSSRNAHSQCIFREIFLGVIFLVVREAVVPISPRLGAMISYYNKTMNLSQLYLDCEVQVYPSSYIIKK
jgi:hypothetical protein